MTSFILMITAISMAVAHFIAYKEYYIALLTCWVIAELLRRFFLTIGQVDKATLIKILGYCIIGANVCIIIATVKTNGFAGGLLSTTMETIKSIFK